ncbi:hypothetical protein CNMCM5793_002393 [Aspergillus hiratsukae]|uniref:Uncharacterized protein n=1 Tax=Aspergillus hiratsukae TaxID=1194566 RepID=A0A8H6PCW2_9EURO|nr:hypothetical protein CNMCM5793_002393 [Aspergillus hiratsukae]KAF7162074.1 hypothetical protein CNMCM6106_009111 [Aspergillus hiratsukae]
MDCLLGLFAIDDNTVAILTARVTATYEAKGKSKSTTHGAFTALYRTSITLAFTNSVSSPNLSGCFESELTSTYALRSSRTLSSSQTTLVFSNEFSFQLPRKAPYPSCICPKTCNRGRARFTAAYNASQPTLAPWTTVSSTDAGRPCVTMISMPGKSGTIDAADAPASAPVAGVGVPGGLNRSVPRGYANAHPQNAGVYGDA